MGPVPAPTTELVDDDDVVATVHHPAQSAIATVILAHGAGGNRDSAILVAYADELCARSLTVARIDLPYRQRRPKGPPSPSTAAADRDGIRAACAALRGHSRGPLIIGGHSYGGRQASMVVAEDGGAAAAGLLLSSYPLHPPGRPDRLRTEHLPSITIPTLVVHGASDPFAATDEIRAALELIPAPTHLVEIDKTGHSLDPTKKPTATLAADALEAFLLPRIIT
ncbi:alpha/beta fold hydrolase [Gordonia sp. DT30]|uniref:alpha/beta hydrolase family protein n=1 Tax=unclassified Gordonia (in: high G+C Gram-positive bacteria) TaxID=2657482 RepID=UPI003CFA8B9A